MVQHLRVSQETHGLTSCAEWTGVSLSLLLEEAGVQSGASWIVAEGAEEVKGASSLPLAKVMDDGLVAYGMNGEPLRPQQGFPLRLIVPGFEGIHQIKYLRRIKVVDRYYMLSSVLTAAANMTWNCTHIANATMRGRIEAICRRAGFDPPVIHAA